MIATYMARITGYRLFLPISGAVFYYLFDCFALPIIIDRMPASVLQYCCMVQISTSVRSLLFSKHKA